MPTHVHRDAVDAAAIVAVAVRRALRTEALGTIAHGLGSLASGLLAERASRIESLHDATAATIVEVLGHGVVAVESVPAAIWAATTSVDFEDAIARAVCLGGDTDSIGAMAGAIAGAFHAVPDSLIAALETPARARAERYARALSR